MQVLETHVGNINEGSVTIEFKREGGEAIFVRMVSSEGAIDDHNAVLRAKEMMVQVATLGSVLDAEAADLLEATFVSGARGLQ